MKISIITVCYNAIIGIEKTIQSVLSQSYPEIEYIVIDGGSTDGTVDVIQRYAEMITYFISEPDQGIYDAMNKGINVATGDWISFLNAADNYYDNKTIESVFANKVPFSADVVYGYTVHVFSYGKFVRKRLPLDSFNSGMPFGHESSFVRSEIMKRYCFDTSFKIVADYNFFYNLYKKGAIFHFVDVIISEYENMEGASSSDKNALLIFDESSRIVGTYNTTTHRKERSRICLKLKIKRYLSFFSDSFLVSLQRWKRYHNKQFIPLDTFLMTYNS